MATMRAVIVRNPKSALELVEKELPEPAAGEVRIKVLACGICHSDSFVKDGLFPNIQYPRVPGHEVAGTIDALGPGVKDFTVGQKVGVGWFGGKCGTCESCRRGDFITCQNIKIPGISYDGGYAEYMVAPIDALALIPDELSPIEAAPLLCAGITTYNALRNAQVRAGDLVAILGLGGLGHLAVQFACKMGFKTCVIARGKEKESLAKKLGAHYYIDSQLDDVVKKLTSLGGASLILSTVTNSKAVSQVIDGLKVNGKCIVLGVSAEPIEVMPLTLIAKRAALIGWPCGSSIDSQDTMSFCAQCNVRSMNEVYPLEQAQAAYDLMLNGKAKFRAVLKP